ncbi:hypothetical protein BST63_28455 [Bradyrhizobium canariense]|uniref:Peptidase S74 domain-containing protein n=1 Tax=Bradyrhizobium canariense TaxID=255045 RepID=A0ABX3WWP1_9BRAD|nr:tail fiber domain-containing protein [Bradyrhizobium canariense]OSJ12257.1 hypothetical protein BSR47_24275 [Bradyrhizobium canariense]OSJ23699.1 hypothetical protein BST63_28455 [Bradyrhizobium canariense]
MSYPTKYTRQYDFVSYQNANPARPLPADKVNADLNQVALSLRETIDFLKTSIRADGALMNGAIGYDQLSPALQSAGIAPADAWAASKDYVVGNSVVSGASLYRCIVSHTSGVFANDLAHGKWLFVADIASGPQGAQGPQGIQGPQGPQGPQGTPTSSANPSTDVGLTAHNGTANTYMPSDAAPALSQAIAPTWTGLHTFTSTAGDISISGSPNISYTQGYFGGVNSFSAQLANITAASQTAPEVGAQVNVTSGVGSANGTTAFKIGIFGSATGGSGSADIYGGNFVGQLSAAAPSTASGIALEADFNAMNAHYGDTSGSPSLPYAVPLYVATGGDHRCTAYMMVSGGVTAAGANRGLVFQSGTNIRLNVIEDYCTVANGAFLQAGGSYQDSVLNLQPATGAYTNAIKIANGKAVSWRNAANSGDIAGLYLDSNNDLNLGSGGVRSLKYTGTYAGGPAMTLVNSAGASTVGINLGAGSNGTADTTSLYMNFVTPDLLSQAGTVARADAAGVRHVAYNTASDERLKKSLGLLDDALDRVMQIDVHKYTGPDYSGADYNVGFFAQNLHKAYPWAVTPSDDPDFRRNPWKVDYGAVTPLLVGALQELANRVANLEGMNK